MQLLVNVQLKGEPLVAAMGLGSLWIHERVGSGVELGSESSSGEGGARSGV